MPLLSYFFHMQGYLIEKYTNMGSAYTCRRLVEEGRLLGMDLRIIGVHDCLIRDGQVFVKKGRADDSAYDLLRPVDFVINRYKTGFVKDAINRLGKRTYNPLAPFSLYINKYEQMTRLSSGAFAMPRFILGTGQSSFDGIAGELGLPFVAKGLESSMGLEILLIENEDDFDSLGLTGLTGGEEVHSSSSPSSHPTPAFPMEKEWLFEEFIRTSPGRDMRLFCIRGQVVAAMERRSADGKDFRANVALGGSVRPLPVTDTFQQIGRDLYAQTGLDFMGIDLLYGEDRPWFCEINVMPGIEGMERAGRMSLRGGCGGSGAGGKAGHARDVWHAGLTEADVFPKDINLAGMIMKMIFEDFNNTSSQS